MVRTIMKNGKGSLLKVMCCVDIINFKVLTESLEVMNDLSIHVVLPGQSCTHVHTRYGYPQNYYHRYLINTRLSILGTSCMFSLLLKTMSTHWYDAV